ncbi:MAG TPA: amidohydrolase family protein [Bacteroidales bacterium]|nr:amidohydrolase family protein [Bacteroidales bacterium]
MKIDSHQHFWKYNPTEYSWISNEMNVLKKDFLPGDLFTELTKYGMDSCIAVQARQCPEETRWLLELATQNDFIKAVVGWVDLCSGDVKSQLDEFTQHRKFVGVRHVVHDEPDDNFILRDDFLNGISLLKNYSLTYDLLLFPKHLPVAERLVSMFPDQPFVLDHISKPLIRHKKIHPWKEDLLRLAAHDNVFCKISGMVTENDWQRRQMEDYIPYLDIVFDAFGENRLMYGSDWPVCKVAGDYSHVLNVVERYMEKMPEGVREKIIGLNCREFYFK